VTASTTLTFEPMVWGHIDEVIRIEMESFGDDAWSQGQFWDELGAPEDLKVYVCAMSNGQVVGYAGLQVIAPEAEILTVAVAKSKRRRGVGGALVAELQRQARARNCTLMHLEVESTNTSAKAMYVALGYSESGLRANYYGLGRDAVLMQCQLAPGCAGDGDV